MFIIQEGRWFCVTNGGQLIPEDSLNSPPAEDESKPSTVGEIDDRSPSISPPSTRRSVGSPRRLRKERPSPLVVNDPTAAKIKDEVFTSPEVKVMNFRIIARYSTLSRNFSYFLIFY